MCSLFAKNLKNNQKLTILFFGLYYLDSFFIKKSVYKSIFRLLITQLII